MLPGIVSSREQLYIFFDPLSNFVEITVKFVSTYNINGIIFKIAAHVNLYSTISQFGNRY
jgi:hypothetical protein